jgi:hypothetical protein
MRKNRKNSFIFLIFSQVIGEFFAQLEIISSPISPIITANVFIFLNFTQQVFFNSYRIKKKIMLFLIEIK